VVLHARANAVTAYGGYQRKLKALWRFECGHPIQAFEVDQNAQFAVVAAGGRLYFIRRGQ
jgi:hypothetical protein